MKAHIVVNAGSIRVRKVGPSTGEIWLELGEVAFPAPGWNDFVVVVLDAWVGAVLRLARKQSSLEKIHFMDGPYEVEMVRLTECLFQLRMFERGIQKGRAEVEPKTLMMDLLVAADAVTEACRRGGDMSVDAARLAVGAIEMRREASQ